MAMYLLLCMYTIIWKERERGAELEEGEERKVGFTDFLQEGKILVYKFKYGKQL